MLIPIDSTGKILEAGDMCEVVENAKDFFATGWFDAGNPKWVTIKSFEVFFDLIVMAIITNNDNAISCACLKKIEPLFDDEDEQENPGIKVYICTDKGVYEV